MAVVCAGPKAILDVPATLEYLETRGVPVVAIGQADLPGFYARSAGIAAPASVADVVDAAARRRDPARARSRWRDPRLRAGAGRGRPAGRRRPRGGGTGRRGRGRRRGIGGPALTPWLLARIAVLTDGASIRANTALIVNDARVAGELAGRLADG